MTMHRTDFGTSIDTRDDYCPYWRCQTMRTFERWEETDDDDVPVAVEYRCESCGRTHDWAVDNHRSSNDGRKDQFRRRGGHYIYQ